MKNSVKSILCLSIVMVIIVALCACVGEKTVVGEWKTDINLGKIMEDSLQKQELGNIAVSDFFDLKDIAFTEIYTFSKNGEFELKADKTTVDKAIKVMTKRIKEGLKEYFIASAKEQGYDINEALELNNTTLDKTVDETAKNIINSDQLMETVTIKGRYKVEGSKLFIAAGDNEFSDNVYDTFKLNGNTLKLLAHYGDTGTESVEKMIDAVYPLTLKRAK